MTHLRGRSQLSLRKLKSGSAHPSHHRCLYLILVSVFILNPLLLRAQQTPPHAPHVTFTATLDFGRDQGQNFGSIFEATNQDGHVVAGAGFMEVYNTRFRSERQVVQFYIKPNTPQNSFSIRRQPHPKLGTGIYLFDHQSKLYAWTGIRGNSVRRWNAQGSNWQEAVPPGTSNLRSGDGIMHLAGGQLVMANNTAEYNGERILTSPSQGSRYCYYYAAGHLFFYHTDRTEPKPFTKVFACPWTPDQESRIDLSKAVVMDTKYIGETPFSWGQFQDQVLTVSNQGGIYVFSDNSWETLLEPDHTVSYQVYSMLNYYDRLLLAQYPSGNLFEYDGIKLTHRPDWPPKLPGVSSSAREAQTLAIYRGDLFVGVWPWAELWRYDHNEQEWHSMGRMFTHPEITDKQVHPYEAPAEQLGLVVNHWGQRVTGLVPLGESLMISTSSKGTAEWRNTYRFLNEPQRQEYGSLLELRLPGNLAAQVKWTTEPTTLDFKVSSDQLTILQDGQEIATSQLPASMLESLQGVTTHWRRGIFGQLKGRLLEHKFQIIQQNKQ